MITLTVKQKRIGPVVGGHPWVFSQAFEPIPDAIPAGEPVRLMSSSGEFLAQGYFSSYSQITVRIWGHEKEEEVDEQFFIRRVEKAYNLRRKYVENAETDSYRLINAESDFLPGLVVDKYGDYLVVQFHTRGIEAWKVPIIAALDHVVRPKGIYERSDITQRAIEGMEAKTGTLAGDVPDVFTIRENGFAFLVDVKKGQKTGFFLDQRDKRKAFLRYTRDKSVLNCFSYTGGFSVYSLAGGARRVVNVDTSAAALDLAKENIRMNGFSDNLCESVCTDVKGYLKQGGEKFDAIVLDPPAFIKDRRKKKEGLVGYRGINEAAMRLLAREGILLTCSCSTHLSVEELRFILSEAGGRTKKNFKFLEAHTHGIDHPVLVPFTEGEYLKCFILSL
ncbi:MAG TPA: class I SAM-dependent rRNA methyltransferase [Syntrophorhabdaceae bacterium]|jgi:23S rRNA (cytosine1962-C5)-methyltransferase